VVPVTARWRARILRWIAHGAVATAAVWSFVIVARDQVETGERAAYRAAGPALLRWSTAGPPGPRTLVVNGADIRVETGVTDAAIATVLDGYAARCGSDDFFVGAASPIGDAVLRDADDARGVLACFGSRRFTDVASLARLATSDAIDVEPAGLRYVYAERVADTTRYVALWSDTLAAASVFPVDGDAPGADPAPLPRPPIGRRAFSAQERGKPYATALYLAPAHTPLVAARQYRDALADAGFDAVGASLESSAGDITWLVRAGDTFAAIAVFPHDDGAAIAVAVARGGPAPLLEMLGGRP
jgi:hypothetical protein